MTQTLAAAVATYPATTPDWQIADTLNAPDATAYGSVTGDIPLAALEGILAHQGVLGALRAIVMPNGNTLGNYMVPSGGSAAQLLHVALTVTSLIDSARLTAVQTSDPTNLAQFQGGAAVMLAFGAITQAQHDALVALVPSVAQSWSTINNGGVAVSARDIGLARGGV